MIEHAMQLLPQWTPLRHHNKQAELYHNAPRFAVVPAGRRSGKTEIAKRKLIRSLPIKKPWANPHYFAAAPTHGQAKRIYWEDLKRMIPKSWIAPNGIRETDLCIKTIFGSDIWVIGLDKPQRIEGMPWDGGVLDEYANMRSTAWTENVRPALSDRAGWCWFIGVPEGLNHYKDLADKAIDAPGWGLFTWFSSDILPAEEVEAARGDLDPRTFRQEYEGSFEGAVGRVYYAYSKKLHSDAGVELNPRLPIIAACDFNINPCAWILLQSDGRDIAVFDEIVLYGTNTGEMGSRLLTLHGDHPAGIEIYGDAAGSYGSTAGSSDYAIMGDLEYTDRDERTTYPLRDLNIPKANPRVKDRVNAVNHMLLNARGESHVYIHPRCKMLIRDLDTVAWREGTGDIDKRDSDRTHASDAFGYYITREFPLKLKRASGQKWIR
jgi:hypothetical protein